MRVLLINPILYTAETDEIPKVKSIKDTMIYTMCLGFLENGDVPVLAAASDYKPETEEEYPFEIVWMDTKLKKIFKPRCLPWMPGLSRYVKKNKEKMDGIITSEVFSLCSLTAVCKAPEKTVVWHELGAHNKIMHCIPSKIWYYMVARIFFRKAAIVARSEKARQFISRFCPQVREMVIDHGVDLCRIKADTVKENRFVVVSQLIGRKRIDRILEAFAGFSAQSGEGQGYMLDIIGSGDKEQELRQLAEKLGIWEKTVFHGKLSHKELAHMVAKAKAMLVYTEKDNSTVSIVESIAAGTPVITTPVPFNAAYIQKECLGIVKEEWGREELEMVCRRNEEFVQNCMAYREQLSAAYGSRLFAEILEELREDRISWRK